ncbi:hypothetical protein [Paenibacillus alba]|uniref:Uncharacterized protein n=1 Tax=Paenibacillus alba TaxID=1197127 RepID=A0ABU6GAT4_9BACL|nr:hypothetical protein [Paenibacillus alba]MEC0231257.1 hypothetical protein [Paenibacillus alba]
MGALRDRIIMCSEKMHARFEELPEDIGGYCFVYENKISMIINRNLDIMKALFVFRDLFHQLLDDDKKFAINVIEVPAGTSTFCRIAIS